MLNEFINLKNKNKFLIQNGHTWATYYYKGAYIKYRHTKKEGNYNYTPLLEILMQDNFLNDFFCKILSIYEDHNHDLVNAYLITAEKGIPIENALQNSKNKLEDFLIIAKQFNEILNYTQKRSMVLKDLITHGNMLYNPKNQKIKVIDLDGIQVHQLSDHLVSYIILDSDWEYCIFQSPKYSMKDLWSTELNIFNFYELFFNIVFQKSLLQIKNSLQAHVFARCQFNDPEKKEYARQKLENNLIYFLDNLNLKRTDDLYSKIVDLVRFYPNNFSYEDFEYLANHYRYDERKKRLIR
ncbi:MAG: hypothetical protein HFI09_04150 [Bacilli bacterium]|nr:hypothetical protein [Bacilli bacterium]